VNGESPVISILLKDKFTGAAIPPSSVVEDPGYTDPVSGRIVNEGCIPKPGFEATQCTVDNNTLFTSASMYVTGPRARRFPVLTYGARAEVTTTTTGPWDLTAVATDNRALTVQVDSGTSMLAYNTDPAYEGYGADELIPGVITVTLDNAILTVDNVIAALNKNSNFKARAIAYKDEGFSVLNRLSIRTRGISKLGPSGEVVALTDQPNIKIVKSPIPFNNPSSANSKSPSGRPPALCRCVKGALQATTIPRRPGMTRMVSSSTNWIKWTTWLPART